MFVLSSIQPDAGRRTTAAALIRQWLRSSLIIRQFKKKGRSKPDRVFRQSLVLITFCWSIAGNAVAVPDNALPEKKAERYMTCVRACLDKLLEHGTDCYGPVHTPMLMSIIDVRTNTSPKEPEVLDGLIRSEGRLHRRNPGGCDLWDDQPLLRTMYTVSEITKNTCYAEAADAYIRAYFERAKKKNGLLAWGSHTRCVEAHGPCRHMACHHVLV